MITFKDFKNKRAELKKNRNQYRELIRTSVNDFISAYIRSLELPGETFQTNDNQNHPYVYVINDDGSWRQSFYNLNVDKVDGAKFDLYTVVDDEPPLPRPVVTRINVHIMDEKLVYVLLADRQDNNVSVSINGPEDLIKFSELVKQSIISKIESEPLGKKTPQDDSIKLWD
ncbi:hypothetical protein [Enterobacter asburiae]|uniref:hypothetical protein n=1 Tax=Enterobacter asburiae TaxID=61645 RepID=UPI002939BA19|nr:hypothetical protein EATA8330_27440 [Enterobacter asburiae]HEC5301845.1 hypothetical protein [Enterobacter asburiae]